MANQDCPLCDAMASYRTINSPNGKRFDCPNCTEFFIDSASEDYIHNMVEVFKTEQRKKLSQMAASASPGKMMALREPNAAEVSTQMPGMRDNMIVEWTTTE